MTMNIRLNTDREIAPLRYEAHVPRTPRIRVYKLDRDELLTRPFTAFWHGTLCTTFYKNNDPNTTNFTDYISCKMMAAFQADYFRRYAGLCDQHYATEFINRHSNIHLLPDNGPHILHPLGDIPAREVPVYWLAPIGRAYAVDVLPAIPSE